MLETHLRGGKTTQAAAACGEGSPCRCVLVAPARYPSFVQAFLVELIIRGSLSPFAYCRAPKRLKYWCAPGEGSRVHEVQ
jgi:hypothetical protein